ncbi:hypothetical protein [Fructilactobacillus florum]|uniref:Integral membrane protein n=1 Tax=Fructilactobacillus florum DSM 22689 = JCM 16035 TaxID=1423745 RepID=A0A0R2CEW8_9LACO|nr:hypothetical protein [Fructilactobacillus florum]KRM89861.1 hypothetical protein FC87_GL000275 [Fructilactobacillus florum DSM 22689 = JCM 16035]
MKTAKITVWSLIALGIFIGLNYVMQLPVLGLGQQQLVRTDLIAGMLFIIPLLLIWFHLRVGLAVLALVQSLYTMGYLNGLYRIIASSHVTTSVKLLVSGLLLGALLVNFYWFRLAWQIRRALTNERVARYLKYRK